MSFLVVYVWRGYKKSVYQKTIVETRYSITEVKQPVAARPKGCGLAKFSASRDLWTIPNAT